MGNVISAAVDSVANAVGIESDLSGAKAAGAAARDQRNALNAARATQQDVFNQQRQDLEPWRQAGLRALAGLESGDFQKDAGYQFRLGEGMKAINAAAAARGGANSGATLKALTRFGQDYAANEFQNSFNRASQLAGLGSGANMAGINLQGQFGQNMAQNQVDLGNLNAAQRISDANRTSGIVNDLVQGGAFLATGGLSGLGGLGAAKMSGIGSNMGGVNLGNQAVQLGQRYASSLAFCDINLKTNISEIPKEDAKEFLDCVKGYYFEYKNKNNGDGLFAGVMAQDLEKSKIGKTCVIEENGIKRVDLTRLFMALCAVGAYGN